MPTVDVENLPYEALAPLETPETDAQVKLNDTQNCMRLIWHAATASHCDMLMVSMSGHLTVMICMGPRMQAALADMGSGDWAIACRGLLTIRRLSKHHIEECRALL